MARIRILQAAEQHNVRVSNNVEHADIPIDGEFHEIHDDLLPVLVDSAVEFETDENADVAGGTAAAGGAAGLGGSAAPPKRKRVRKSRAKAKKAPA